MMRAVVDNSHVADGSSSGIGNDDVDCRGKGDRGGSR